MSPGPTARIVRSPWLSKISRRPRTRKRRHVRNPVTSRVPVCDRLRDRALVPLPNNAPVGPPNSATIVLVPPVSKAGSVNNNVRLNSHAKTGRTGRNSHHLRRGLSNRRPVKRLMKSGMRARRTMDRGNAMREARIRNVDAVGVGAAVAARGPVRVRKERPRKVDQRLINSK